MENTLELNNDFAYAKISSSAMLVDLSISVWTARKLDKKVSQEVDQAKSTRTRAGNYHKNLLAGSVKLDAINKLAGEIRTWHYAQTSPWSDSGTRLLPSTLFFTYKDTLTRFEQQFNKLVDEFLAEYDILVAGAGFQLGALFDRSEYPTIDKIRHKFAFNYFFSPVPESGDWRVDIGEQGIQELKDRYNSAYKVRVEASMKDVWSRVYDVLSHISDKLKTVEGEDKKPRLYDSMMDNTHELIGLLKHLNVTSDPRLTKLQQEMERLLSGVTTDDLRESDGIREKTKRDVDSLLDKFGL